MKTAAIEVVAASTARPTSEVPARAASSGDSPISMWR